MQTKEVAALLDPFTGELPPEQLNQISTYIDILLKWNEKTNLTAVRDPREIVMRHFGESLFAARAETLTDKADLVTLRAVEKFDEVLPIAGHLVKPGGRLALLIGTGQIGAAHQLPEFTWQEPLKVPQSRTRVLLTGNLEVHESPS